MINKILIISILILSTNLHAQSLASHNGYIEAGSLGFNWKEFHNNNDNPFDDETEVEAEVVDESGRLTALHLGYKYILPSGNYFFSTNIIQEKGSVDYYGRIQIPGIRNDYYESLTTNYNINSLEASFGKHFNSHYIKPLIAIVGGYSKRKRRINGMEQSISPIDGKIRSVATVNEHMSYLYWAALLDIELFSWNNISAGVGAKYTRSVNTEQEFVDDDLTIDLKPVISTELLASINYVFLPTWEASLLLKKLRSKMEKSNEVAYDSLLIHQPRSEQNHNYLGLRLQKTF